MPNLGPTEIIIIAFLIVLLFGSKRLPDAARSIGRSLRIFKAETKGLREDDKTAATQAAPLAIEASAAAQPVTTQAPVSQPAAPQPPVAAQVSTASANGSPQPADADRR